jgi:hypothetical protein
MEENKNLPANPVILDNDKNYYTYSDGLTKREYAAIHILSGMVANPKFIVGDDWSRQAIDRSVYYANTLFKELDK